MSDSNTEYECCRYSITCETSDLAVVHCLRAICQFAERGLEHPQIAWGGTGEAEWKASGNRVTLRFTDPAFRDAFVLTARDVLREGLWEEVDGSRRDNDPAERRRLVGR
jgi:hypothetical protein